MPFLCSSDVLVPKIFALREFLSRNLEDFMALAQHKSRRVYSMNTALPIISHFAALAASDGLRVGINRPTWLRHIDVERVVPADLRRSSRSVW